MAIATLARAEGGIRKSASYTNPVIEFLANHPNSDSMAAGDVARLLQDWSARHAKAAAHDAGAGVWLAMLPVLFIGLIAPLSLKCIAPVWSFGRGSSAPLLPSRFQRPPPTQLS